MQTNMRFMYLILKYECLCVWRSGLRCMLQQATALTRGFPCNMSDWEGLHYNVLYMSWSDRHNTWLFLIFLVWIPLTFFFVWDRTQTEFVNQSWVSGQLGYWSLFWLWKRFAVNPNGRFSSCGCSPGPGVTLHCIFWIPPQLLVSNEQCKKEAGLTLLSQVIKSDGPNNS